MIIESQSNQLALLTEARRALAECRSLGDVLDIRDKAEAVRSYLRMRGEGIEAQNHAAEIQLRAARKAGELLHDMKDDGVLSLYLLKQSKYDQHNDTWGYAVPIKRLWSEGGIAIRRTWCNPRGGFSTTILRPEPTFLFMGNACNSRKGARPL